MNKQDWVRLAIHLPWGLLAAALFLAHPALGITALSSSLVYEAFNDWRKQDESFKDVLGIVWGWFIGSLILWVTGLI